MECIRSTNWINKLNSTDKVLLVNPPVQEVRYAWIKWNQPTDLLVLSSKLKKEIGCQVEMVDFMLPSETGRVTMKDLARKKTIGEEKTIYRTRTYGMPLEEFKNNFLGVKSDFEPTHVIVTSLTSYWYETFSTLLPSIRILFPNAQISVMGAYPIIETEHATKRIRADYLIIDSFDNRNELPDFDLYFQPITQILNSKKTPAFGGLIYTADEAAKNVIKQVQTLRKYNIRDLVIFESNVFRDECVVLDDFLSYVENEKLKISLHGLCGIQIGHAKKEIYTKMQKGGFRSFFLEYELDQTGELDLDSYRLAYHELVKNRVSRIQSGNLSGFLMIGTPEDNLEKMFKHCLNLLEICGSIIPKPFTPNPETELYKSISAKGLDYLSPHVFPMAELTGITRQEYMDFYKHTTFLNEKRMGQAFDFFDDRYSAVALRRSLGKKEGAF